MNIMVSEAGLEPARETHTPLKRTRLPVPPLRQFIGLLQRERGNYSTGNQHNARFSQKIS